MDSAVAVGPAIEVSMPIAFHGYVGYAVGCGSLRVSNELRGTVRLTVWLGLCGRLSRAVVQSMSPSWAVLLLQTVWNMS
jgi:hypothetical protein